MSSNELWAYSIGTTIAQRMGGSHWKYICLKDNCDKLSEYTVSPGTLTNNKRKTHNKIRTGVHSSVKINKILFDYKTVH